MIEGQTPVQKAFNALLVVTLDPHIRMWLFLHDPKALEQVEDALESMCEAGLVGKEDTDKRFDPLLLDMQCQIALKKHCVNMLRAGYPNAKEIVGKAYHEANHPFPKEVRQALDTYQEASQ